MFEYEDKTKLFNKYRKDERSLYDKLIALSKDPGATPAERSLAADKAAQVKRKEEREGKPSDAEAVLFKTINRTQSTAGWYYKPKQRAPRKRSYNRPIQEMWREAHQRSAINFEDLMGLKDHKDIVAARQKIINLMGMPQFERHVCLINAKLTKLFLFWTFGISRDITWFFIERDVLTGKTKKSKRYFSREEAMAAFHSQVIGWKHVEYI